MKKRATIKNIAISLLIASLCMAMFLGYDIIWDTNDDGTTAMILAHPDNNFAVFFPKFFTAFFSFLYADFAVIEWWLVGQLFTIFISLAALFYVIRLRFSTRLFLMLCVPIAILTQLAIASEMNFTRTASFAALSGILLIVQAVDMGKGNKPLYIAGTLLMLLGTCYRFLMAFTVLPFGAVAVMLIIFYRKNFKGFKGYITELFKQGSTALICAVLVLLFGLLYPLGYSIEEREAVEYNTARANVLDYDSKRPRYEDAEQEYTSLGITENDYKALTIDWLICDTDYFTTDFFKDMHSTFDTEQLFSPQLVWQFKFFLEINDFLFYLFVFFATLAICADRKRLLTTGIYMAICAMAILYLLISGRINDRVLNSLLFTATLFSTFFFGGDREQFSSLPKLLPFKALGGAPKRVSEIMALPRISAVMMITVVLFWGQLVVVNLITYNFADIDSSETPIDADAQAVYDYIGQNPHDAYIFSVRYLSTPATTYPIWMPKPTDSPTNLFFIGHWDAYMPYKFDRQESYGIRNLQLSLTENENTISSYTPILHQYLKEHVDEDVTVSFIEGIEQPSGETFDLVQYCAPLDITEAVDYDSGVTITDFSYRMYGEHDSYLIEGELPAQERERYSLLYCHITQGDRTLSYKVDIDKEGGGFSANLFELSADFDSHNATIELYARTTQGELVKLCEVGGL